jgi:hypothetical protein
MKQFEDVPLPGLEAPVCPDGVGDKSSPKVSETRFLKDNLEAVQFVVANLRASEASTLTIAIARAGLEGPFVGVIIEDCNTSTTTPKLSELQQRILNEALKKDDPGELDIIDGKV